MKKKGRKNRLDFETILGNPFGMDVEEVLSDTFNINHIQHLSNSFFSKYLHVTELMMFLEKACDLSYLLQAFHPL